MNQEWETLLRQLAVIDILIGVILWILGGLNGKGGQYVSRYFWWQIEFATKTIAWIITLPFVVSWSAAKWCFKKVFGAKPKPKSKKKKKEKVS